MCVPRVEWEGIAKTCKQRHPAQEWRALARAGACADTPSRPWAGKMEKLKWFERISGFHVEL